jgi:plasmid stabilization system protein ParE
MKLRWTTRAANDWVAIQRHIAKDKPGAAKAWVDKLRLRARHAASAPLAGRIVPEFGRADLREVFVGAYRIVYRVQDDGIAVLTVFEGHRLLGGTQTE